MKNKTKVLIVTVIVVFVFFASFIIRWWDVVRIPYGIEGDEGGWVTTAKFLGSRIDPLENGILGGHVADAQNHFFSIWINQIAFWIFGVDIISPRKMLVFISVLGLIVLYFILKQFFKWYVALFTTALYSFSAYKLISSKIAVPTVYQELPVLSAILLVLLARFQKGLKKYTLIILASFCTICGLLAYNITYLSPLFIFGFLLYTFQGTKLNQKKIYLNIICFVLPLVIVTPFFISILRREFGNKRYIFANSNTETTASFIKINSRSLSIHGKAIYRILWAPQDNANSDFLLYYTPPQPLIPHFVTLISLLGFILALVYWRKFWPFLVWLIFQVTVYHVILGFNVPRTWFLTTVVIYVFFGVAWQSVLTLFSRQNIRGVINAAFILLVIFGIIFSVRIYYLSVVNSPAYKSYIREAYDIVKHYKQSQYRNILIIPGDYPLWADAWTSSVAFNKIGLSKDGYKILSGEAFQKLVSSGLVPKCSLLVGEPFVVEENYNYLLTACNKSYRLDKYQTYWVAIPY